MPSRSAGYPHLLEIMKIIEGAVNSDAAKASAYCKQLAEKLEGEGHERAAAARLSDEHAFEIALGLRERTGRARDWKRSEERREAAGG